MSAVATIDLDALERNIALATSTIAPADLMMMVKANAYGHGLGPVAAAAASSGVPWLGVLDRTSALTVRSMSALDDTRLFTWLFDYDEDFGDLIENRVDLGISHVRQLDRIAAAAASQPARVHLKIDTGLHRSGASEADWPSVVARAVELHSLGLVDFVGVWTHIGEASDDDDTAAMRNFDRALEVVSDLGGAPSVRHLAASAAGFARTDSRYDAVRVGAFTYGIAPGGGVTPQSLGLTPVMTLTSEVVGVRHHGAASIATVAAGFVDGVLGDAADRVDVSVAGARHRLIGPVRATEVDVDVTGSDVRVGDDAVLFGSASDGAPTLQEWADAMGTIGEEIVVRLSPDLERHYRRA
ncbi:alanine racemase [Marisediminicola sp. LYQ134]|uniref:alanine racemase n=1 Tax=unclassified Marisediminicola TaxID=2618316 RepID=UPI0039831AAF